MPIIDHFVYTASYVRNNYTGFLTILLIDGNPTIFCIKFTVLLDCVQFLRFMVTLTVDQVYTAQSFRLLISQSVRPYLITV